MRMRVTGAEDGAGPVQFVRRRRESVGHVRELVRMDAELAREAQASGVGEVGVEGFRVPYGGGDAVDRRADAELAGEVDVAEGGPDDTGRGAHLVGPLHAEGRLDKWP
ncbi:hypothetical protein AB5J56_12400 [Streptomyces sp. R21]|uniref:Uncharacterized protein n=1 Tax=Streptomyces sp. R21 TaxID=3238627 RepID=A0AB39P4Z2_9ACTN